jgi:hypothetical protein
MGKNNNKDEGPNLNGVVNWDIPRRLIIRLSRSRAKGGPQYSQTQMKLATAAKKLKPHRHLLPVRQFSYRRYHSDAQR